MFLTKNQLKELADIARKNPPKCWISSNEFPCEIDVFSSVFISPETIWLTTAPKSS